MGSAKPRPEPSVPPGPPGRRAQGEPREQPRGEAQPEGYEILDHTADVALRAFGENREALLENAARGMFSVMFDLDSVPLRGAVHVQVEAASFDDLLAQWLKELIYLFDVEGWAFANFHVKELSAPKPDENGMWRLSALAEGGPLSETVRTGAAVKAVTYHSFSVRQIADGSWQAHLVFDI